MTATRTYTVQKKDCAERIAPIGTLSQNGYGDDSDLRKATVATPSGAGPRTADSDGATLVRSFLYVLITLSNYTVHRKNN